MANVRISYNAYGNYRGIIGGKTAFETGTEHEALFWLSDQLEAGHTLLPSSYLTMNDVIAHREDFARVCAWVAGRSK